MNEKMPDIDALLRQAEKGGAGAALAARRAAWLAESIDPDRARQALALAARLEPLDATPRLALARLHAEAGDLDAAKTEAEGVLNDAVDQAARARAAFILGEIARGRGDLIAAREAFNLAAKIEEGLLKTSPMDPNAARWFARIRGRLAELDAAAGERVRARTGAEGALSMLKAVAAQLSETPPLAADIADGEMRLGALELDAGEAESARRRLAQAIGRYEALILVEPDEPHWRAVLADAWALAAEADYVRGAPQEARDGMDKALAVRVKLANADPAERWALAGAWRTRAALLAGLDDAKGVADSLAQARALAELMFAQSKAEAPARFLVHTLLDQADHALRTRALNTASEAAHTAGRYAEPFARAAGASAAWMSDLAACWDRVGEILRAARSTPQDAFARAVEFRRMARDAAPGDAKHQRALASALLKSGDAALAAQEMHSARVAFSESTQIRLRLAEGASGDARAAYELAIALERMGVAAMQDGDREGARAAWESELDLAERIYEDARSTEGQRFRAIVEAHLASLGGIDAADLRAAALTRLDQLARDGVLTERDTALRKRLWST